METNELAAIGFATALIVSGLLTAVLLGRWQSGTKSLFLAGATGASVLWCGAMTLKSVGYVSAFTVILLTEWLRYFAWFVALIGLYHEFDNGPLIERLKSRYGVALAAIAGIPLAIVFFKTSEFPVPTEIVVVGYPLCVLILGIAEQIYRNTPENSRSELSYLCVAIAGMFFYDLTLYVATLAGQTIEETFWSARGYVNALFTVMLAVGIRRAFQLSFDVQAPRQIVFYSFGLTAIGIYVILAILGQYYIRIYGGSWGDVAAVVFVVAAIAFAAVLLTSISARRRLRVFLTKAFFQYKYDYRNEWLRFISTLSESGFENVAATAVRAVAQIVNSPGGIVWIQDQDGEAYRPIGSWCHEIPAKSLIGNDSGLIRFLNERQWVIDLEERQRYPARYEDLVLETWFQESDDWWLIVPLYLGNRLFGFICLQRPRFVQSLNFEDHDLLRTVGRHVAMHVNQAESDKRLAESSQFGTYNRLTAFLMHDLNNLIAQQSLVIKNAERFRHNPEFVDDAIGTIANSVSRMKRLMEQLSSGSKTPARLRTDLRQVLSKAIKRSEARRPIPTLHIDISSIHIEADPERLTTVFEHLIRNAQDASKEHDQIEIEVTAINEAAIVSISDTGAGMSPDFIRERLFRPFDSTKGSQAMGIGAYQARDYIRTLGGNLEVSSEVSVGTIFTVQLPVT